MLSHFGERLLLSHYCFYSKQNVKNDSQHQIRYVIHWEIIGFCRDEKNFHNFSNKSLLFYGNIEDYFGHFASYHIIDISYSKYLYK